MGNRFRNSLFVSGGIIIASILLGAVVLYFLMNNLGTLAKQIIEARAKIFDQSRAGELLAQFKNSVPEANTYTEKINLLLPSKDQLLTFPQWLEARARVSQVRINFSFRGGSTASTETDPGAIGFSLDVTGSYEGVRNFLTELEGKTPRFLLSLDNLDLTRTGEEYQARTQGRLYFK